MADLAFDRYSAPKPTPYHQSLANLLARKDAELWSFFQSDAAAERAAEAVRFELLKRTRRLDKVAAAPLYAAAEEIAEAMGVTVPVALYEAITVDEAKPAPRNAALYFDADAAHILFEGDILTALDEAEMRFVIGHELAHHTLWTQERGKFWTAYRLLRWASGEAEAAPAYAETARLERLYTEAFADRYGLWAVGDLEPALRAHEKLATGANEVSGAAYLAAAEDMLRKLAEAPEPATGPGGAPVRVHDAATWEGYARAVLLSNWAHQPASAEARAFALFEGTAPLDRLDLLGQERVDDVAHWMLYEFLCPPWSERDLIRGHAAEISPRLADLLAAPRHEPEDLDGLRAAIAAAAPSVRRFYAYLLLDFATVDPQIDDVMLAAALVFAEDFGLTATFKSIVSQELKTTKTKLAEIEKSASEILARAEIALGATDTAEAPPAAAAAAAGGAR